MGVIKIILVHIVGFWIKCSCVSGWNKAWDISKCFESFKVSDTSPGSNQHVYIHMYIRSILTPYQMYLNGAYLCSHFSSCVPCIENAICSVIMPLGGKENWNHWTCPAGLWILQRYSDSFLPCWKVSWATQVKITDFFYCQFWTLRSHTG